MLRGRLLEDEPSAPEISPINSVGSALCGLTAASQREVVECFTPAPSGSFGWTGAHGQEFLHVAGVERFSCSKLSRNECDLGEMLHHLHL